jgi:hypothetical protein
MVFLIFMVGDGLSLPSVLETTGRVSQTKRAQRENPNLEARNPKQ